MGFFRSASLRNFTTSNNANNNQNESSVVTLLKTKISSLEEQLHHKDSVIEDLQHGLKGNPHWMNKIRRFDMNASCATSDTASSVSGSSAGRDHTQLEDPVVTKLSAQLEDKNNEIARLQIRLEEQRLLTQHMQDKLAESEEARAALDAELATTKRHLIDQSQTMECLQAMNETNQAIVAEMDDTMAGKASPYQQNNQWKMYQKLQDLMSENNVLVRQTNVLTQEKQGAFVQLASVAGAQKKMAEDIEGLTKQLKEKDKQILQLQMETGAHTGECTAVATITEKGVHANSVLPEVQQVLDIYATKSMDSSDSDSNASAVQDPRLLQLSLQVCQSQLKQIQRDHELQTQKTVRQSVALAETRAKVDTLTAKVEHYEGLMDAAVLQVQQTSQPTSPRKKSTNVSRQALSQLTMVEETETSTSMFAPLSLGSPFQFQLGVFDANDAENVEATREPPLSPLASSAPDTGSSPRRTGRRLSLPNFMGARGGSARRLSTPPSSQATGFNDVEC